MTDRAAVITGVGLWSPTFHSGEAWTEATPAAEPASAPPCTVLHSRAKRGTSLVTRMAVEVVEQAAHRARADLSCASLVLGSSLGEVQTAVDQMAMIESEDGRMSPTRFKNSVHNTAAGLLSIAEKNRGFSTAIAAGAQTVTMSLIEAMSLLLTEWGETGPVIMGVSEERVPPPFDDDPSRRYEPFAVAFCLEREGGDKRALASVTLPSQAPESQFSRPSLPEGYAPSPIAGALALADTILRGRSETVPLELGAATPYAVTVTCRA